MAGWGDCEYGKAPTRPEDRHGAHIPDPGRPVTLERVKKPEVMSPAGYWPQLHAAIEAGADAVYFGLKHFSARAKVGFEIAELPEVMRTLHARGVRGYLTFNTLVFEHELQAAADVIAEVAAAGVDALIVQDIAILKLARAIAPNLELHASTQMSVTDSAGVRFAQSLGVSRVTLARELSISEIKTIHEQTGCELEMFVHGALCVAYSGQCFSSEAWGGRSANRGQCAQACRLPYELLVDGVLEPLGDARYLLSPGDLYALEQTPEIVAAGVGALKIEGRYKDADYVALTTNAYRRAVDAAWAGQPVTVDPAEKLRLEQVYSRGLGAHFVNGTDHQAVVRGRAPRHRGILMGTVVEVGESSVRIRPEQAHRVAPLKAGDGVVFDAAEWRSPGEREEGGRVFSAAARDGLLTLEFGNRAVNFSRIRQGDLLWRTDDPNLAQVVRPFLEAPAPVQRQAVTVRVCALPNQPLRTDWWLTARPEVTVHVTSELPLTEARNRGLGDEQLRDQFGRLGGTPYILEGLELDIEGSLFAPVSVLNQVRRDAVSALAALQQHHHTGPIHPVRVATPQPQPGTSPLQPQLHLLVRTPEQLEAALELAPASITLDYLDLYGLRPSVERVKAAGLTVRVASPRVLKPGESRIVKFLTSVDCEILVRASGILHTLRQQATHPLIGDFSLNAANALSAAEYLDLGLARLTPTHDLNAAQVADLARAGDPGKIEAIAFQHLPVFHTEHCVFCRFLSSGTSYRDCGRPCEKHRVELRDQSGRAHPVMADVGCRNTVFGAEAQDASPHLKLWLEAGIRHYRLEFAHESAAEVRAVTLAWQKALAGTITPTQLSAELRDISPAGTTQGSLHIAGNYLALPILQ